MPNAIEHVDCSSAEILLKNLERTNKLWGGYRHFWAFRGHSDDKKYKLIPSALRDEPKAMLGYTFDPKQGIQPTNDSQKDAEFQRLHEFYWAIDAQGLHVPGDNSLFRTPRGWTELEEKIMFQGWPVDELLPLLALAQHYGVPTRLLDWTEKPLVAAFFAVKGAVETTGTNYISVWAINLDWIINTAFPSNTKMSVYVVTAPRASNPNLHAQGGIFTTENLTRDELHEPTFVGQVDTIVEKQWNDLNCSEPVMAHLKLPCSEGKKLLRLLNQEGINSATLFPGYQGVADSLTERELWDTPERATFWMKI